MEKLAHTPTARLYELERDYGNATGFISDAILKGIRAEIAERDGKSPRDIELNAIIEERDDLKEDLAEAEEDRDWEREAREKAEEKLDTALERIKELESELEEAGKEIAMLQEAAE